MAVLAAKAMRLPAIPSYFFCFSLVFTRYTKKMYLHAKFSRKIYEKSLYRSLDRRPTPLTVWMFNRITNAEKDPIQKSKLIEALTNLLSHPKIDVKTRDEIKFFVEFQNKSK